MPVKTPELEESLRGHIGVLVALAREVQHLTSDLRKGLDDGKIIDEPLIELEAVVKDLHSLVVSSVILNNYMR